MTHLDDLRVRAIAAGRDHQADGERTHLDQCQRCRQALRDHRVLILAARVADRRVTGSVLAPTFGRLLPLAELDAARPVRRPSSWQVAPAVAAPESSWSLCWQLLVAQLKMFSPLVMGLAVGVSAAALAAGLGVNDRNWASQLSAAALGLLLVGAAMLADDARRNVRVELFTTLPVAPRVVYVFRLTAALTVSVVLALLVSAVQDILTGGAGAFASATLSWLGPGLLAASCAALIGARWNATAGQVVGMVVWAAATLLRLPAGPVDAGLGHLHPGAALSSPLMLAVAAVLFVAATLLMPGRGSISAQA